MPTPTTTYSLSKPTVGGDDNAWGTEINNNLDKLDDLLDGTLSITPNLATGWEVGGVAVTSTAAELNILDGVTASAAEINILDGVTATTAELNYVDGVTSNIQTQLDAKQPLDADLTAIAALTPAVDRFIVGDGSTWTTVELPSGGVVSVSASAPLASSGGATPTISLTGAVAVANGGTGATTAADARTNLDAQEIITGAATSITTSNLIVSRALTSDASGKVAVSAVTSTELGYLDGVTSAIQTQLNAKAANTTQLTSAWQAGTSTTETIVSPAKVKAAIDALVPTWDFTSSEQTITLSSKLTVAHGLGALPTHFDAYLVCKTAQSPYVVGEVVLAPMQFQLGASGYSLGVSADATNIYVRVGAQITLNTDAGGVINLTAGSWRIVVRARA